MTKTTKLKCANHYGVPAYSDLERELAGWIKEKHQGGYRVSINVICLKANLIAQKSGMQEGKFRALKSSCYFFMEWHGLSVRCHTTVAQKLLEDKL